MSRENSKKSFSKEELEKIVKLVDKLKNANRKEQKTIREKIRKLGLYWSEITTLPYTVANLEKMFAQGILKLDNGSKAQENEATIETAIVSSSAKTKTSKGRDNSDEYYVIDLCDEVLGMKASRQHKFDFLKGDTGIKLPVDAYYESLNLVVEYHEKQHSEKVPFFDKETKMTISGVPRGEQRKIYDQRRKDVLPAHGIKLVIISYDDFSTSKNKKLSRNKDNDILIVKRILNDYIKLKNR